MAGWRLQLKGQHLMKIGKGASNAHQLHMHSGVSYPTVKRYLDEPEKIMALDAGVLPSILIDGLGLTPEELMNLRLGDLFELVRC